MAMTSAPWAPRLRPLSLATLRRAYVSAADASTTTPPPFPPQHVRDLPVRYRKEVDKVPGFDTSQRRALKAARAAAKVAAKIAAKEGRTLPKGSSGTPSKIEKHSDKNPKSETDDSHRRHGAMYVPQVCHSFFRYGRLQTTPDVWEFLQENDIEYDNAKSQILPLAPEYKHITQTFACKIKYSRLHIMHPYHLIYLQPRGHAFMESLKVKYRAKKKTQPLWFIFTGHNSDTGLIRSLGQRRLLREFWLAMEELGARGPELTVSGTIMVAMYDSKKAASAPAWQFGHALADAVVKQYKWDQSEHRNLKARKEPEPKNRRRKPRGPKCVQWDE